MMALSTYSKTTWADGQNKYDIKTQADSVIESDVKFVYKGTGGTPVSAANMNKIENQLEALTEDALTPTYSASTTATQQIIPLSSTALKSRLEAIISGNTDVNIVTNGNFANGTTGYGNSSSTLSASNNTLSVTGTGGSNGPEFTHTTAIPIVVGNKYYVAMKVRVTNANCTSIVAQIDGSTGGTNVTLQTISNPVQNQWYTISGVGTIGANFTGVVKFNAYHTYADAATANGKVMEVKEVMAIDLTSRFGAGSEPDAATCLLRYPQWFDGVKSSDKMRVLSVGKNLFDKSKVINGARISETDGTIVVSAASSRSGRHRVPQNSSLKFSNVNTVGGNFRYALYDVYGNFLSGATGSTSVSTGNACFIEFSGLTSETIGNAQLESGSTATTYEPYTETSAIIPVELKGISSTIKDTFNANNGLFTKNISDWVTLSGNAYTWSFFVDGNSNMKGISTIVTGMAIDNSEKVYKYNNKLLTHAGSIGATDIGDISTSRSNGYLYITTYDTDTGWDESWASGTSFTGMTWAGLIKAYMNGWKLTTANTNVASCVWTGIASGTTKSGSSGYTDVTTTIDTGFTPYKMIYQLATPVLTDYLPSVLTAEPSGTVYVYPFVEDVGLYGSNITIENSSYPISSLDYVYKINVADGSMTPVALSSVTVAAGGLSFTISGASAGEYYLYGYTHKDLSTVPDTTYSYSANLKATVDSNRKDVNVLDNKLNQILNSYLQTMIPRGLISMWSGALANIPDGWALCDGTNGTPNLLDRFICSITDAADEPGDTGGSHTKTLTTTELPAHTHTGTTDGGGSHNHENGIRSTANVVTTSYNANVASGTYVADGGAGGTYSARTTTEPNHTHTITTNSTGTGSSFDIRPKYYELAFIMKL